MSLSRSDREKCWGSRDKYWECLEKNDEAREKCVKQREEFVSLCPSQWVKHFDRKREYLVYKEKVETEGYDPKTKKV